MTRTAIAPAGRDLVAALLARNAPIGPALWAELWERLRAGRLAAGEAQAVLASLAASIPDGSTLAGLVASLRPAAPRTGDAANLVGTGGGPATFNVSTAAAFVAAAMGLCVVKSGSRAYTGRCGSLDLLERLGVPLTRAAGEIDRMVQRFGIAFAGPHVYPRELTLLAKAVLPFPMRTLGRGLNLIGPFLADLPVSTQVTGLSHPRLLGTFRAAAAVLGERRVWLGCNELGADELLSFARNTLSPADGGGALVLEPTALGLAPGRLADLAPPDHDESRAPHFLAILAGQAPPAAIETVCLNAAALAVTSDRTAGWTEAIRDARAAILKGRAIRLVEAIRSDRTRTFSPPSRLLHHV